MKQKIYIEMRKDPIVEEIRRFRAQHAKRFDNDLDLICEDIKRHQAICGHKIVNLKRKRFSNESLHLNRQQADK